jgi:hypothetical protein
MKKIIKLILIKISRIRFWIHYRISRILLLITPWEFKSKNENHLNFADLLDAKIKENLVNETFSTFKEHLKKSVLFNDVHKIREYAISTSLLNDKSNEYYYLEFGVWKGKSANFFSKYVKKFYAFDGFEGLEEDWKGTLYSKGALNLGKKIPKLNSNVEPVVGWVEDTLELFLKEHSPKINFVHLDMDTYIPTRFTLEKIKPYLVKNAIIVFDELYGYVGWEHGEYKALNEVFKKEEFEYKAFNVHGDNCVVQIK